MTSHRARLLCAARRLGQDDGAALASTLRDGVVDPRSRPEPWPIGALLEVLKRSAAGNDCQVPLTIQHLKELRDATAELSELRAEAEETKA